jgi:hypothetical protein
MSCFDVRLLRRLIGISANALPLTSSLACLLTPSAACLLCLRPITRTWVTMEKLSKNAVYMTETDVKMGRGASIILGIHKLLDNDPLLSKLVERFVDCPFGLFWT